MRLKHKVTINVAADHSGKTTVLRAAWLRVPTKLLKLLVGDFTQVYFLAPGQTVQSVDIQEVKEGGKAT